MKIDACPDQLTLEKLLLGKLSGTEQESLSLHLQNCQTCASVADTLMPRDEVTDALRSHKVLKGDEEILAAAIERGKKLSSRLQTVSRLRR